MQCVVSLVNVKHDLMRNLQFFQLLSEIIWSEVSKVHEQDINTKEIQIPIEFCIYRLKFESYISNRQASNTMSTLQPSLVLKVSNTMHLKQQK